MGVIKILMYMYGCGVPRFCQYLEGGRHPDSTNPGFIDKTKKASTPSNVFWMVPNKWYGDIEFNELQVPR